MTQITTNTDLLNCKPMFLQVKEHSKQTVKNKISGFLVKCSSQLGMKCEPNFIETLSEDVIDKFKYESLEDIAECLKKGRQGTYDFEHENRSTLSMIIISKWMRKHLDEKASTREKHLKQSYQTSKEPLKVVDYEKFKQRITAKKPKIAKGQKEMLDEYIKKVCQAMQVDTKELFKGSRKKEIANVRGLIKTYQSEVLRMTREQIKEYWNVCSD